MPRWCHATPVGTRKATGMGCHAVSFIHSFIHSFKHTHKIKDCVTLGRLGGVAGVRAWHAWLYRRRRTVM